MDEIGLIELIEQIKQELLSPPKDTPLFAIDNVELEVAFTVARAGNGKLDLKIVSVGGDLSSERIQRIKVTLAPLITTEELRERYRRQHPEQQGSIAKKLIRAEDE